MALDQLEHQLGRRAVGEHDPGRADAEREQRRHVAGVAEEQLRDRQHDVIGLHVEHPARVRLEAEQRRRHPVDARFRPAGAAGRELPDRDRIPVGRSGLQSGGRLSHERIERELAGAQLLCRHPDDEQPSGVARLSESRQACCRRPPPPPRACSRGSTRSPWSGGTCRPRPSPRRSSARRTTSRRTRAHRRARATLAARAGRRARAGRARRGS